MTQFRKTKIVYFGKNNINKILLNCLLSLSLVSSGLTKDFEVVAIPGKSQVSNGNKVGIFVQIKNVTSDKKLLLIGGILDKNGTIFPRSIDYDLTLYEITDHLLVEKWATTGFLSQEFPTEKSNFASKTINIELDSYQTACYFFEITPFPKGRKESYCVFKFRLPINNKMNEIVVNLERIK